MDKPWHICASNAVTGEGLNEAREIDVKSDYYDYQTNLSFFAIYFAGRGMVDGSNKRWYGWKKIVLDPLFSLSFNNHLLSFQVRPFFVHFAYQSVPF